MTQKNIKSATWHIKVTLNTATANTSKIRERLKEENDPYSDSRVAHASNLHESCRHVDAIAHGRVLAPTTGARLAAKHQTAADADRHGAEEKGEKAVKSKSQMSGMSEW